MDDGLEAPLQLRAAIELVIQLYFQNLAMVQTAISGAMGMAQQAGMPPPEEEPEPQETPDNKAKIADKKEERSFKASEAEKDRKHEKQLLKMKPKPKGKAA
jgi:hypothetical protein